MTERHYFCGAEYETAQEAEECEAMHTGVSDITKLIHRVYRLDLEIIESEN